MKLYLVEYFNDNFNTTNNRSAIWVMVQRLAWILQHARMTYTNQQDFILVMGKEATRFVFRSFSW